MNSSDAMAILIAAFPLDGVMTDIQGNLVNLFAGDFSFAAAEVDDFTLRLSAQMDGLEIGTKGVARRLLEANLTGVETGAGGMAPDPVGNRLYALVETVDISRLDADDFRLRVVDFMLYVEYWRSEGITALRASLAQDKATRRTASDMVMLRA